VFPETPIADDAYLRARELKAVHWRRGWRSRDVREDGVVVRIGFFECPADCPCHDDDWWTA